MGGVHMQWVGVMSRLQPVALSQQRLLSGHCRASAGLQGS